MRICFTSHKYLFISSTLTETKSICPVHKADWKQPNQETPKLQILFIQFTKKVHLSWFDRIYFRKLHFLFISSNFTKTIKWYKTIWIVVPKPHTETLKLRVFLIQIQMLFKLQRRFISFGMTEFNSANYIFCLSFQFHKDKQMIENNIKSMTWNPKSVSTFNSNSNAILVTKKTWSLSSESATPRFYSEYYMSRYMSLDSWCVYTCVWYTLRSYRIGPFSIL